MEKENLDSEFVPYNSALRMKALGFDEPCFTYYSSKGSLVTGLIEIAEGFNVEDLNKGTLAPLFQQAFKWFRDEHKLYNRPLTALRNLDNKTVHYNGLPSKTPSIYTIFYDTYEEAELACLEMLLDIVETKFKENGEEDNIS